VLPDMVNPFWVYMKEGADQVAAKYGAEIEALAPLRAYQVEDQIRIMEDLIEKQVDAIVVVAGDSTGIVPGVEAANAAGIPVITPNTRVFGGEVVTFVGYDNIEAMYTVTKYTLEAIGGEGKVILLEGTPGSQTGQDRTKGMQKATAEFPDVEVLASQNADFQRAQGMAVTENLLQRFPEVDAVICANDEIALGAIEAIAAAGREDEMLVAGFDGNKDAYMAIVQGRMFATLDQNPWAQAGLGVEAAIKYLNGEEVEEFVPIEYRLVTGDNVVEVAQERFGITLRGAN
jgi:ribose transport system substrate-binding protein